jgi:hypothetical protein
VSAKAAGTKAAFSQSDQRHRQSKSKRKRESEREREVKKERVETQTAAGPESEVQEDFTASHRHIASDNVKSSSCMLGRKMYFGDISRRAPREQ